MGKDPGIAVVAGLIFLGGGQFYTEQWAKGVAVIVLAILGFLLFIVHPLFILIPLAIAAYSLWDAYSVASGGSGFP